MDVCIDTQILVKAGLDAEGVHCLLLTEFRECGGLRLAIDRFVRQEYDNKMRADRFGQIWLKTMIARDRVSHVERLKLPKPLRIQLLDDHHFDPDDICFVEVALAIDGGRLVAEEKGYKPAVVRLLAKNGVTVLCCPDCRNLVHANQNSAPLSNGECK